jgi:predicted aspartyl protease
MGVFRVPLEIGNPIDQRTETVEALVDTGAIFSMAPSSLLQTLGIEPVRQVRFRTATGESVEYPTGWASFSAEGQSGRARVVFGPEGQFLLGATTLEDLLLTVDPIEQRLVPVEGLLL